MAAGILVFYHRMLVDIGLVHSAAPEGLTAVSNDAQALRHKFHHGLHFTDRPTQARKTIGIIRLKVLRSLTESSIGRAIVRSLRALHHPGQCGCSCFQTAAASGRFCDRFTRKTRRRRSVPRAGDAASRSVRCFARDSWSSRLLTRKDDSSKPFGLTRLLSHGDTASEGQPTTAEVILLFIGQPVVRRLRNSRLLRSVLSAPVLTSPSVGKDNSTVPTHRGRRGQ